MKAVRVYWVKPLNIIVATVTEQLVKEIESRLHKYFYVRIKISSDDNCEIGTMRSGKYVRLCTFQSNLDIEDIISLFWLKYKELEHYGGLR